MYPLFRPHRTLLSILLLHIFSISVHADTCSIIQSKHPDISLLYPHVPDFNLTVGSSEYWSTGCSDLWPSCVLLPRSAEQVSDMLKVLHQTNESFAIKSGGHNPNQYFSSIRGGPLIATKLLNGVAYNAADQTV
jgi:hypothetical protein